jgi:hypothetical protein
MLTVFSLGASGGNRCWEKKFVVRHKKTHGKLMGLLYVKKKCTTNYFLPWVCSLTCTLYKTHGKEALYRAPEERRTTNILTHGKSEFSRRACSRTSSLAYTKELELGVSALFSSSSEVHKSVSSVSSLQCVIFSFVL